MGEQIKLFELIPKTLPVPENKTADYWIGKCKEVCQDAKRKYEQGKLYEYQKKKNNNPPKQ